MCELSVQGVTNIEAWVSQEEPNRLPSPSHDACRSIPNMSSAFGSSSGVGSKTITSSLGFEHPTASLHFSDPPGDELSAPSGEVCSGLESISPNQGSEELSYHDAAMDFQGHTSPGNPTGLYFYVSRMRLHMSPQIQMDSSNTVVNFHVIDIDLETDAHYENRQSRNVPAMKLGKTFLGLTYQAMISFLIFHLQAASDSSPHDHSHKPSHLLLQFAEVSLVVGFAASLIGILLCQAYPEKSVIIERAGSMSAAFGFFIMMSMALTSISIWVGWICSVGSLLAFVIVFSKRRND